jgi:tetratricopeptide (TPR) repeat protein/predicted Ser/Thr protein kinase
MSLQGQKAAAGPGRGDIALEKTMASASSLPPLDPAPGASSGLSAKVEARRGAGDGPAPGQGAAGGRGMDRDVDRDVDRDLDPGFDPGFDPATDAGPIPSLPKVSDSFKRFSQTPPEVVDSLRRSRPPPLADEELPRGASIGRYIVVGCIGSGGMGVVYAAYDPELDRKVATKLLRKSTSGGPNGQGRVRLLREAQAMARLSHPQVIGVFDVGTLGDQVFIAMEFVDGGTLTKWLSEAPRSQKEIIEKFTLAGRGLSAAHAAGLVHRDFKPDNVLVGTDGRVRVMDFGLAHSVGSSEERSEDSQAELSPEGSPANSQSTGGALALRLTRTGALLGTPRYMSPEQYEGKKTDPRTDQFSFCVALYEALFKVPPFAGETFSALGHNVVRGRVLAPPPEAKVPAAIRQVILRGLSVRPSDRFPSMDALLEALNPQPQTLSKSWLVTLAVLALAILGNLGYQEVQRRKVALCQGADRSLAGIWEPGRKQSLKQALLGTGQAFAADSWQAVERTLDEYTRDWVAMRTEACNSTVRGEQSKVVHDLRMRCLDRRLDEVAAIVDIMSKPSAPIVESAASAAHNLTPLSGCANIEALTAPTPIPDNPVTRRRVEQVTKQLDAIRAMEQFGNFSEVRVRAEEAVRAAAETNYLPVQAEALYLLGEILDLSGLGQQAEDTLLRAAAAAIEGRDQRLIAQTWILLVQVTGFRLKDYSKARAWAQLADAAIDLLSDQEPMRGQLLLSNCMVASQAIQNDKAIENCRKSLALREKVYGAQSFEAGAVMLIMAGVYRHTAQYARAMELYKEALAIQTHFVGPFHPDVRSATRGIGLLLREQRKYAEADTYFRKALETSEVSLGPRHIRTTDYQILIVANLISQGKLDEAERLARTCVEVREHPTPPDDDPGRRAQAHYFLGEVLRLKGVYEEALGHYRISHDLRESMPGRSEDLIAYTLNSIGETLVAMDNPREGLPYLERALSYRESRPTSERVPATQQALARTEFALARALWALGRPEQRVRALELGYKAQQDYEQYGQRPDNDLELVSKWLSEVSPVGKGKGASLLGTSRPAATNKIPAPARPPRPRTPDKQPPEP